MKPDHGKTACMPCRHPGEGPFFRPHAGYIVERIVDSRCQRLSFDGLLQVSGLPACLCPPLTLCDVAVTCIEPCGACSDACCMPCRAVMLRFALCCTVADSRGCRGEGRACIELAAPPCFSSADCGANIRRGAQLRLAKACFCPPCAFEVCLLIDLRTVISQCEMLGEARCCGSGCPMLPIYPAPVPLPNGRRCEHFCVLDGKNPRNA